MNRHSEEIFEQIKSYTPYVDEKLNALVDLCELLNAGMIDDAEYVKQRDIILRGRDKEGSISR